MTKVHSTGSNYYMSPITTNMCPIPIQGQRKREIILLFVLTKC